MGFLIAIALAAATADPGDVLAPARTGQVQCYVPNPEHKTCAAMAGYDWAADGTVSNRASVLLAPSPVIVATTRSPVVVRDGAVCGQLVKEDFQNAAVTMDGKPATPEVAQKVHDGLVNAMSGGLGKEICTAYLPDGDSFASKVSIDGVDHPEMHAAVIWVRPEDGWKVSP